jgi:hypothetical protein
VFVLGYNTGRSNIASIRKWKLEPILWCVRLRRTHRKIGTLEFSGRLNYILIGASI